MRAVPKIGPDGDFYTSAHIGTLMGEMLAACFVQYWREQEELEQVVIAEWGGGTGRLAKQLLDELAAAYPDYYDKVTYHLVDTSSYHRSIQDEMLNLHAERVFRYRPEDWLSQAELPRHAIVFSNELLDAFPVHLIVRGKQHAFEEIHVGWDEARGQFIEQSHPLPADSPLLAMIDESPQLYKLPTGTRAEINPDALVWIDRIARIMQTGMLITIDYGELEELLYTTLRPKGTLMCYYRHQAHDNPYVHLGEQDITAHVNFSACMRTGEKAGMTTVSYETQRQFLLRNGILERLQAHTETDPFHPAVRRNRAIQQLLLGDRMGEVFKVLIQTKS